MLTIDEKSNIYKTGEMKYLDLDSAANRCPLECQNLYINLFKFASIWLIFVLRHHVNVSGYLLYKKIKSYVLGGIFLLTRNKEKSVQVHIKVMLPISVNFFFSCS